MADRRTTGAVGAVEALRTKAWVAEEEEEEALLLWAGEELLVYSGVVKEAHWCVPVEEEVADE